MTELNLCELLCFRTAKKSYISVLYLFHFITVYNAYALQSSQNAILRWFHGTLFCFSPKNHALSLATQFSAEFAIFCFALVFAAHWNGKNCKRVKICEIFYEKKLLFQHVRSGVTLLKSRAWMKKTLKDIEMVVQSANEGSIVDSTNCQFKMAFEAK